MTLESFAGLAHKKERIILGLMSGTSIDGLDLAVCAINGSGSNTACRILHHNTVEYNTGQRELLRYLATSEMVKMEDVALAHAQLAHWHAEMISQSLKAWGLKPSDIDAIASHGQTVRHAPIRIHGREGAPNATLQIGDADHLAYLTGIPTISDFRQKHVAAGGEGAPLACYGDKLLFYKSRECRILLNIGGISNITVLDGLNDGNELPLTFDTGPGNTLMDAFVRELDSNLRYDVQGEIASSGTVNSQLLSALKSHVYFQQLPPKTTGPELLSKAFVTKAMDASNTRDLSHADTVATLNRFTAETIADAISMFVAPKGQFTVFVSGGGVHNKVLMWNLKNCMSSAKVTNFSDLGIHPDAKEALLFAVMANEFICGNTFGVTDTFGITHQVRLGRLSLPD